MTLIYILVIIFTNVQQKEIAGAFTSKEKCEQAKAIAQSKTRSSLECQSVELQ